VAAHAACAVEYLFKMLITAWVAALLMHSQA
jgi:hypothetical protein